MQKAVFVDKDGTLISDIPYNIDPEKIKFLPYVIKSLKEIQKAGFKIIVITNQSGVARGYFSQDQLESFRVQFSNKLLQNGVSLDGFYYCPHYPKASVKKFESKCVCRKPLPGLIFKAAEKQDINLSESFLIGDILDDIEAGNRAGCKTILLDSGGEKNWNISYLRLPDYLTKNFKDAAEYVLHE